MRNEIRAFYGPDAEQRAERAGHFLKALAGIDASKDWCVKRGFGLRKAVSESGGNQAGGFLVPDELDNAILAVRDQVGAFRRGADIRASRSMSQVRPRRVGGLTANVVAEGVKIPESSFELDAVETSLKKLAILARSSTELYEDSEADVAEFVAVEVGYAFATTEDNYGFNGDGTSAYGRITGLGAKLVGTLGAITAASGHNTFGGTAAIDNVDLANLMAGVLSAAIPGAAWYCSAICFAQTMCRLAGGAGGGVLHMQEWKGINTPFFLGFPVAFSSSLPNVTTSLSGKPMLYFGDLKMASMLVEKQSPTVVATSFDRALDFDQVLLRGTRRVDIVNHLGSGMSDSAAATTNPPVAVLIGN